MMPGEGRGGRENEGVRPRRRSQPIYYVQDHCTASVAGASDIRRASDVLFVRAIDCREIARDRIDLPPRRAGGLGIAPRRWDLPAIRPIMCPIQEVD